MPDQIHKISGGVNKNKNKKKPINPALKKLISNAKLTLEMLKIRGAIGDLGYGLDWSPEDCIFSTWKYRDTVLGDFSSATSGILGLAEFIVDKEEWVTIDKDIATLPIERCCGQLNPKDALKIIEGWGFKLPSPPPYKIWRKSQPEFKNLDSDSLILGPHVSRPQWEKTDEDDDNNKPKNPKLERLKKYYRAGKKYEEYKKKFVLEHSLVKAVICAHAFKGLPNYSKRDRMDLSWYFNLDDESY